jgi:hypothetical protein
MTARKDVENDFIEDPLEKGTFNLTSFKIGAKKGQFKK